METDSKERQMPNKTVTDSFVIKGVRLESPTKSMVVGFGEVQVAEVFVRVVIRRFRDGTLRVFMPVWEDSESVLDAVELPSDLRVKVEQDVLEAYRMADSAEDGYRAGGKDAEL